MPGPQTRVEDVVGNVSEKVDLVPVRNWKLLMAFEWGNMFKLTSGGNWSSCKTMLGKTLFVSFNTQNIYTEGLVY